MGVTDILFDIWAFEDCNNLTSIEVYPDNLKFASDDGVLYNKEKTELIKYPNGRQGDYLIPETVITLGEDPFRYSLRLTSITKPPNHPEFSSEDGVLFNKDKMRLIKCPNCRQGDYVIPDSVVVCKRIRFTIPDKFSAIRRQLLSENIKKSTLPLLL